MLSKRLQGIEHRIAHACESCGRKRQDVQLIAVTKTIGISQIQEAYDLGLRDFGESRWQEAEPKIAALPKDIRWHFIGKLQSNKVKKICPSFWLVHSLETNNQLKEIAKLDQTLDALIEVNIAKEPQKSGILPEALDDFIQSVLECENVRLKGLMTVGPLNLNAELMRPYFQQLRQLSERVRPSSILSMGMSGDFEVAIQEGSTHIRVGTALFGERN